MHFLVLHIILLEISNNFSELFTSGEFLFHQHIPSCLKKSTYLTPPTKCRQNSICHTLLHLIRSTSSEYRLPNNTFTDIYVGFTIAYHVRFKPRLGYECLWFCLLVSAGKGLAMSQYSWSRWPRGLRCELSSLARTLGSWVRIPLKAWMSLCVYCVCVVLCVGSCLATGWSPVQGVLPTACRIKELKKRPRSNKKDYRAIDRRMDRRTDR
jgi:hypothetical protein